MSHELPVRVYYEDTDTAGIINAIATDGVRHPASLQATNFESPPRFELDVAVQDGIFPGAHPRPRIPNELRFELEAMVIVDLGWAVKLPERPRR